MARRTLPLTTRSKIFLQTCAAGLHEGLPYSIWQLLDHMRITQRDILDFCAPPTGGYQPLEWPASYWTKSAEPPSPQAWDECIAAIRSDRKKFEALLNEARRRSLQAFSLG